MSPARRTPAEDEDRPQPRRSYALIGQDAGLARAAGAIRQGHRSWRNLRQGEDGIDVTRCYTVSADTVYDLFTRGELPSRKVGRKWRTTRNAVLRWIASSSADDTMSASGVP